MRTVESNCVTPLETKGDGSARSFLRMAEQQSDMYLVGCSGSPGFHSVSSVCEHEQRVHGWMC